MFPSLPPFLPVSKNKLFKAELECSWCFGKITGSVVKLFRIQIMVLPLRRNLGILLSLRPSARSVRQVH